MTFCTEGSEKMSSVLAEAMTQYMADAEMTKSSFRGKATRSSTAGLAMRRL